MIWFFFCYFSFFFKFILVFISKIFKQLFDTIFAICGDSNYFENRNWREDEFLKIFLKWPAPLHVQGKHFELLIWWMPSWFAKSMTMLISNWFFIWLVMQASLLEYLNHSYFCMHDPWLCWNQVKFAYC